MPEIETILSKKVNLLLNKNHKVGDVGGKHFDYTCPSPKIYPHQWLWDSCFQAIVLTHSDPERAKREMTTLLSNQDKDGFIPCVSIWNKRFPLEEKFYMTKITQPPVIPMAIETIFERTKDLSFVKGSYPKLKKFMNWFLLHRDNNKNGLIEIIHPWEDGDDGNPSFDGQLGLKTVPSTLGYFLTLQKVLVKYALLGWDEDRIYKSKTFRSETVLFNSIYAKSLKSLSKLAGLIRESDDAKEFNQRYQRIKKALIDLCWSEKDKIFYDLSPDGKQSGIKSISSLMPLILSDLSSHIVKPLVEKHLLNPAEFWTPVPIASVARDEKTFSPGGGFILWRGPMWVNTNWFLAKGLQNYGYIKEAKYLVKKTKEVVDKNGFWEFYNPLTGEGYGQPNLGWSTLVADME